MLMVALAIAAGLCVYMVGPAILATDGNEMMPLQLSDVSGWMDETGVVQQHILTAPAGIAFLAIMVIAMCLGRLARSSDMRRPERHGEL